MSGSYRNISMYEQEIPEMKSQGKTLREIGNQLGFSYEQLHNFISRHNEKQRKIAAGIAIKKKGRPAKDSVITEEDKLADLRYKSARKDARIKQLEMENELMRDRILRRTSRHGSRYAHQNRFPREVYRKRRTYSRAAS